MSALRRIAQTIRHFPLIERAEFFWRAIRPIYLRLLDLDGTGVKISVGNCASIRMPIEFVGGSWEKYEPETVQALVGWLGGNPGGLVLDIGCSIGIFSAVALSSDERCDVVAFDSDLASLAATRRMCRYAPGRRLQVVQGLLCEESSVALTLAGASASTDKMLDARRADLQNAVKYICLGDVEAGTIRRLRLDDLLPADFEPGRRAMLIKCDVEGAELLVMRGGRALLERARPHLLLSVHPRALPTYGHSRAEMESYITGLGYKIEVIAVDHEEHWWCEPLASMHTSIAN